MDAFVLVYWHQICNDRKFHVLFQTQLIILFLKSALENANDFVGQSLAALGWGLEFRLLTEQPVQYEFM